MFKRHLRTISLVVSVALATAGCGIIYKQPIYQGNLIETSKAEQLAVGQSKQQVLALLGSPSIADPFHAQRWDYTASERTNRRGSTEIKNLTVFFEADAVKTPEAVVEHMKPYIAGQLARGVWLQHITRHMLGLFHGVPGGKHWRRVLSQDAVGPGAGLEVIDRALDEVQRRAPLSVMAAE